MRYDSVRFKITSLFVVILGVILIAYNFALFISLRGTLMNKIDSDLERKARAITSAINLYRDALGNDKQSFIFAITKVIAPKGVSAKKTKIDALEKQWLKTRDKLDIENDYINLLNPEGKTVVSSANAPPALLPVFSQYGRHMQDELASFSNVYLTDSPIRLASIPITWKGYQYVLQIGTSIKPIAYILRHKLYEIAISSTVVLVLMGFLGNLFATRILRPVSEITKTAQDITHEDLSARIEARHVDEELRRLVDAFNEMIARLEKSFKLMSDFGSHVAHELKTPITIIRGEAEVALRKDRDPEEYKRVIRVSLEESGRILKTIEDMLLLARLDWRPELFTFEQIDSAEFFGEIAEQARMLASRKNISFQSDIPADKTTIRGDRIHLRRLFFNLINNAIKFTPEHGKVVLAIKKDKGRISSSVTDTGIGIDEKDLPKIFDRFFHIDRTGQEDEIGNGLGLSIAQSIAKIHNGDITAKSQAGRGSTFTVILPAK